PVTAQWFFSRRDQGIPVGIYGTTVNNHETVYTDERALGEIRYEPKLSEDLQLFTRFHVNHYHFVGDYQGSYDFLEDYEGTWGGLEARVAYTKNDTVRVTVGGEAQHHPQAALYGGAPFSDGNFHPDRCSGINDPIDPTNKADKAGCDSLYLYSEN